jgi:hypothetical protein
MAAAGTTHHVFVDFENVHTVDLALIAGKSVHVTLLIGEKHTRLDLALVRQIHGYASQVSMVGVAASGRNALDLVLAYHLGQSATLHPQGTFYIVSKDKDFNPLIAHLRTDHVDVSRHEEFAALPFLATAPRTAEPDDRLPKLIDRLANKTKARPVRRQTLLSHIHAFYSNRLSPVELEDVVKTLEQRGIIAIDARGKVSYP